MQRLKIYPNLCDLTFDVADSYHVVRMNQCGDDRAGKNNLAAGLESDLT